MYNVSDRNKVMLIAVDGLSFPLLQKWMGEGNLPFFKRMMEEGSCGLLKPFSPSNSAVIWTSVMTGMSPKKHGIDSFIFYRIGERVVSKKAVKKILKFGVRPLFQWLKKREYIHDVPFSLEMVRQKMLWEIFAEQGKRVGVINWWYSWPAYDVPGFIVSDRVAYWRSAEKGKGRDEPDSHLVFPGQIQDEVLNRVVDPFQVSNDVYSQFMKVEDHEIDEMKNSHYTRHQLMSEFKYLYAMDESVRRLGHFCLKEFPQPDFLSVYFRGIDIISHCALKYMPCNRGPEIADKEVEQYGDTVCKYYIFIDSILEVLMRDVATDTTVMVVSDHGFEREPDGRFGHRKTKPPGLCMVKGEHIKRNTKIKNASLYDIAPTILYLSGLPVSQEMEGQVLTECIDQDFFKENQISSVASYGTPLRPEKSAQVSDDEEEIKERLRALGYID